MSIKRLIKRAKPVAPGGEPGLSPRAMAELRAMVPERDIAASLGGKTAPVADGARLLKAAPTASRRFGAMQWMAASVAVVAAGGVGVLVYQGVKSPMTGGGLGASDSASAWATTPGALDESIGPVEASEEPAAQYDLAVMVFLDGDDVITWDDAWDWPTLEVPDGAIRPTANGTFIIPVQDETGAQAYWGVRLWAMNYDHVSANPADDGLNGDGVSSPGWFQATGNVYLVQREDGVYEVQGPGADNLPYPVRFTWFVNGGGDPCEYPPSLDPNVPFTLAGGDDDAYNRTCATEDIADGGLTYAVDVGSWSPYHPGDSAYLVDYQPRFYYPDDPERVYAGVTYIASAVWPTEEEVLASMSASYLDGDLPGEVFGECVEELDEQGNVVSDTACVARSNVSYITQNQPAADPVGTIYCFRGFQYPTAAAVPRSDQWSMCGGYDYAEQVNEQLAAAGVSPDTALMVQAASVLVFDEDGNCVGLPGDEGKVVATIFGNVVPDCVGISRGSAPFDEPSTPEPEAPASGEETPVAETTPTGETTPVVDNGTTDYTYPPMTEDAGEYPEGFDHTGLP
ncbi:MAG: hypothetical protein LBR27_09370 [Bifidobacteriaceae bacterium]|jgi:hypothetical protein|nr:hypothetical protein [Bifidobacteriaceae bacterium]